MRVNGGARVKDHDVRLMIACRLHFEPGNLKAIEIVNSGDIGEPGNVQLRLRPADALGQYLAEKALNGGPLIDLGIYCINAERYLFEAQRDEVVAFGAADPRSAKCTKWSQLSR